MSNIRKKGGSIISILGKYQLFGFLFLHILGAKKSGKSCAVYVYLLKNDGRNLVLVANLLKESRELAAPRPASGKKVSVGPGYP